MIRSLLNRMTGGRMFTTPLGQPLSCPEVGRLLQRFLDDELDDPTSVERIIGHLDDCRRCGLEAEAYAMIKSALAQRRIDVPPESVDRLRAFGEQLAGET